MRPGILTPLSLLAFAMLMTLLAGCGGDAPTAPPSQAPTIGTTANGNTARVLVTFNKTPGAAEEALVRGQGGQVHHTFRLVPAMAASIPQKAVEALKRNPKVTLVEDDAIATANAEPAPWGVDSVNADTVISGGNAGTGVKVAVLDTGVDYRHPDLDANYKGGYDFVNADADPLDDQGHGTHVAGTIAAENDGVGVLGVAPGAHLYALKVLDATGAGNYSNIIAALDWCVQNGMQVVSMSLGGSYNSKTLEAACANAFKAGVLLVAGAGNSGDPAGTGDTVDYPAKYASVIAVAAVDSAGVRAWFSSTGPAVELAAPGVAIRSTLLGGGYGEKSGTSMACPHVSGVAALVIASGLTGSQALRDRLISTATDLGTADRDTWYGYGLVEACKATGTTEPLPPTPQLPELHVASITMTKSTVKGQTTATANIKVVDAAGKAVSAAAVRGRWSGLTSDTDTATTKKTGLVAVSSNKTKAKVGSFTFTVTAITKSGWAYNAAANVETADTISLP